MPGGDYNQDSPSRGLYKGCVADGDCPCQAACLADGRCQAWTVINGEPSKWDANSRCCLKHKNATFPYVNRIIMLSPRISSRTLMWYWQPATSIHADDRSSDDVIAFGRYDPRRIPASGWVTGVKDPVSCAAGGTDGGGNAVVYSEAVGSDSGWWTAGYESGGLGTPDAPGTSPPQHPSISTGILIIFGATLPHNGGSVRHPRPSVPPTSNPPRKSVASYLI